MKLREFLRESWLPLGAVALWLVFWGVVIYVAVHFIRKFW